MVKPLANSRYFSSKCSRVSSRSRPFGGPAYSGVETVSSTSTVFGVFGGLDTASSTLIFTVFTVFADGHFLRLTVVALQRIVYGFVHDEVLGFLTLENGTTRGTVLRHYTVEFVFKFFLAFFVVMLVAMA